MLSLVSLSLTFSLLCNLRSYDTPSVKDNAVIHFMHSLLLCLHLTDAASILSLLFHTLELKKILYSLFLYAQESNMLLSYQVQCYVKLINLRDIGINITNFY